MRVLIFGIVGAAVSTAGWMAIEHSFTKEFGWMAVVVGLVTGLAVHAAAGAKAPSSYGRGALAVLLALIACVSCRQIYAKAMAKTNVGAPALVATAPADEGSDTESDSAGPQDANEPIGVEALRVERGGGGAVGDMRIKKELSQWDMLWLSLAALSAYLVGKGPDRVVAQEDATETPESSEESDAEPA